MNNSIPGLRRRFEQKADDPVEINSGQHIVRILVGERLQGIEGA